ncbi:hypothetical protein ACFLRA_01275 [Bdellovibrionota bacterium]
MTRYFLPRINFLFVILFGLACLVLQSTAFAIFFRSIRPDLILVIVVFLGLHRYALEGGLLAVLLGYLVEIHSGAPTGLMMTVYVWIFVVAKLIGLGVFLDRVWAILLLVAGMSILEMFLIWLLSSVMLSATLAFWPMAQQWVLSMVLQLFAAPLIFRFFSWLDDVCQKERPTKITGVLGVPEFSS